MSLQQLTLPLNFDRANSFASFYSANDFIVRSLKRCIVSVDETFVLISGGVTSGKSHLLNAVAQYSQDKSIAIQYFHASMLLQYDESLIHDCAPGSVLIIDDVDELAGHKDWERKLYDLYNTAQRQQWLFVVSCLNSKAADFILADWRSRMTSGLQITLPEFDDVDLKRLLQLRAHCLGLKMNAEVADFLFNHYSRSITEQLKILGQLDKVSLAQNRKLTIPFIKEALNPL